MARRLWGCIACWSALPAAACVARGPADGDVHGWACGPSPARGMHELSDWHFERPMLLHAVPCSASGGLARAVRPAPLLPPSSRARPRARPRQQPASVLPSSALQRSRRGSRGEAPGSRRHRARARCGACCSAWAGLDASSCTQLMAPHGCEPTFACHHVTLCLLPANSPGLHSCRLCTLKGHCLPPTSPPAHAACPGRGTNTN